VQEIGMQISIARAQEQYGPYALEQVRDFLAEGRLLPTDMAWAPGRAGWCPLAHLMREQDAPGPPVSPLAPPAAVRPIGGNARGGSVLAFDARTGQGLIAGADGMRYVFASREWLTSRHPLAGLSVDFMADAHGNARQIYALQSDVVARLGVSRGVLALVCFFFGLFGIHRIVVGKVGSGVAQLILSLTVVGMLISGPWAFVDFILILAGSFTTKDGTRLEEWW
jgi:TM2 domain/GYF domain 2